MAEKINIQLTTPVFRVSFPHIFKPHAPPNSKNDPKYSIDMLYTDKKDLVPFENAIKEILTKKFGSDSKKWPKMKHPVIKDGDEKENLAGYPGTMYVTARSGNKPTVVDRDKQEILDTQKIYAGCYARAQVSLYWYDNNGNKGVGVGLNAVQFIRDGEAFGAGRVNVDKAFGDDVPDDGADDPANYGNESESDSGF